MNDEIDYSILNNYEIIQKTNTGKNSIIWKVYDKEKK